MKIYVGNLSYRISEEELKAKFERFGKVDSVEVAKDVYTGNSKGFAFVEMPSSEESDLAIRAMHGAELNDRALVVNEARPGGTGRKKGSDNRRRSGFGRR